MGWGERGGGSNICAPKLLPKCVAKLHLECLPHCATQSHFLHRAQPQISIFSCQAAKLCNLLAVFVSEHLLSGAVVYLRRPPHPCPCAQTAATPLRCCPRPPPLQSPLHLLEDAMQIKL